MPLSSATYGVRPLTDAVNRLPASTTIIRGLDLFTPKYLTTTYFSVEQKNGVLSLVNNSPRGTPGQPAYEHRGPIHTFECLHLAKHDVVRADDVQNIRAFGTENTAETVASKVNDKLLAMKSDLEYTREHLMLGALQGKLVDANGDPLLDIYDKFGLTRQEFSFEFSKKTTNINMVIDSLKTALRKKLGGESLSGWTVLCSEAFMQSLVYHESLKAVYERYQDGALFRTAETNVMFAHKGIEFVQYDHVFESGIKISDGEAIILPKGTRSTFAEYFAPADMSDAVNTKALAYYASREKLRHDKGWDLEAQSNPLPLVLRPELVATLKSA